MSNAYAILATGGKQIKVHAGQVINVELLHLDTDKRIDLEPVLMISDGDDLIVGTPEIKGAKVVATCLEEGKAKKIIIFRYKNKTRHRKKTGHRQPFTRLLINEIVKPDGTSIKKLVSASKAETKPEANAEVKPKVKAKSKVKTKAKASDGGDN